MQPWERNDPVVGQSKGLAPWEAADPVVSAPVAGPPERQLDDLESGDKINRQGVYGLSKGLGVLMSSPAVVADMVGNLFRKTPSYPASDFAFKHLVDPANAALADAQFRPGEKPSILGATVGGLIGAAPSMVLGMPLRAESAVSTVAEPVAKAVGRLFAGAVPGAQPMAASTGLNRQAQLEAAGASPDAASNAALADYAINSIGMAGPVSATGNVWKRAGSGAVQNVVSNKAAQGGVNMTLDASGAGKFASPIHVLDGAEDGPAAVVGALMGAALGQKGGPRIQTRAQQGYLPPPDISESIHPAADISIQEQIQRVTGAPVMPDTPEARADQIKQERDTTAQRARELRETFGPVVGNEEKVYPQLAERAPASMEDRVADAAAKVGETPESIANQFALAYGKQDTSSATLPLQRTLDQQGRATPSGPVIAVDSAGRAEAPTDSVWTPHGNEIKTPTGVKAGVLDAEAKAAAGDTEARRAFDVAEAQAGRKQGAQDEAGLSGQPRDLSEARAGGTTTPEGTAAVRPESFTFLDAQIRNGQMAEGQRVEVVEPGLTVELQPGKPVPASRVRLGDGSETIVPDTRLSSAERPANPRFAQDIAATTYAPKPGVGTGEQQPAPRRAGQRITTEASPEFLPAERQQSQQPRPTAGRDVIDLALDRLPNGEQPRGAAGEVPALPAPKATRGAEMESPPDALEGPRAAPPVASEKPQKPGARPGSAFLAAVRKAGGIDPATAPDAIGDNGREGNLRLPGLMRRGGMTADGLVEWARDNNYLTRADIEAADANSPGGAHELAFDLLRRAMRNEHVDQVGGEEARAEQSKQSAYEQQLLDEASQRGIDGRNMTPEQMDAAIRKYDEDRAWALDEAMKDEGVPHDDAAFEREVRRIVDEHDQTKPTDGANNRGGERVEPPDAGTRPQPRDAGVERDAGELPQRDGEGQREGEAGRDEGTGAQGEGRPDFGLEQPTEAGLRADADAKRRADEQRASVENAPPPEEFGLTGSDRPADVGAAKGQGTLYGGAPLDRIARALGDAVGLDVKSRAQYVDWAKTVIGSVADKLKAAAKIRSKVDFEKLVADESGQNPAMRVVRGLWHDLDTNLAVAIEKAGGSPAATKVRDLFGFDIGKGKGTGETYFEHLDDRIGQRTTGKDGLVSLMTRVDELIDARVKVSGGKRDAAVDSFWTQLRAQIQNPGSRQGEMGKVAGQIEKFLREELKHQKDAGVAIEDAGKSYFPRELDREKVYGKQAEFLKDAEAAFKREAAKRGHRFDFAQAADDLLNRTLYGEPSGLAREGDAPSKPSHTKERYFGKEAEAVLNRWYRADGGEALVNYLHRSTKRAWIARNFGDNFVNWKKIEAQVIKEGGGPIVEQLRDYVAQATGQKSLDDLSYMARGASYVRSAFTLGALDKAVLPNLIESIAPIATSHAHLGSSLELMKNATDGLFGHIFKMDPSKRRAALKEFAEDAGLIAPRMMGHLAVDRIHGAQSSTRAEAKIMDKFFLRNMMTELFDWNRINATGVGQVWLKHLAKAVNGESLLNSVDAAKHGLRDLGIPAGKEAEFAKFLKGVGDELPTHTNTAADKSGMGALYRNALRRYVDMTMLRGNVTERPGYANTPYGALIYSLQNYTGLFHKHYLARYGNEVAAAANPKAEMSYASRAQLAAGMLPGFALMIAASYAVMETRDKLNELAGVKKNLTETAKVERAVQNVNILGRYTRIFEAFGQQRFGQGVATVFSPGALAQLARGLDAAYQDLTEGSHRNAGERKMWKWVFNTILEPAFQMALGAGPGVPLNVATKAATVVGPSAAEGAFVDTLAGEKKRGRVPLQKGVTETIFK